MTECTVHQAAEAFIGHLRESGKKERTLYTYRKDLDAVEAFFGADRQLAEIRLPQVGKFYKSDLLLKLAATDGEMHHTDRNTLHRVK
jgi:site-specific recombinase XerD